MTYFLQTSIESFHIGLDGSNVRSAKLSHCADYVVIIDELSRVGVCCLSTGQSWRVPVRGAACSVALNADTEFAVLTNDGNVQRFDLTLPTICLGTLQTSSSCCISYDHTGTMLVVAQTNGKIQIYDLEVRPTPRLVATMRVSNRAIPFLSSRLDTLIGLDRGGRLFCVRSPEVEPQILWNGAEHLDLDCYALAIHPFLARAVAAGFGRYVRYYRAFDVVPITLITSFKYIRDLVFLLDVNQLAIIGDYGLEVWNLETNSLEFTWNNPADDPAGKVICVRPIGNKLRVLWT